MATLTKSTGTVTLSGAVEKVSLPAVYGWVWVKNMSDADMFLGLDDGISAGADGVLAIPAGECGRVQTDGQDSVYLMGSGNALVVAQNYADCPFKAGGKGGEIPVVYGENLLINPDFKINQRGITGTKIPDKNADGEDIHTYFVDRWGIDSGSVTINADGTLTLNGTISQIFENAVGENVTASVSAGAASYDNAAKTFTITGNGDIISWAKLEYGKTATPFGSPEPATELMKCCYYFQIIDSGSPIIGVAIATAKLRFPIPIICPMRTPPTLKMLQHTGNFTWSFIVKNVAGTSSFTTNDFSEMSATLIRNDGASMNVYIDVSHTLSIGEIVYTSGNGGIYFELDAEIY